MIFFAGLTRRLPLMIFLLAVTAGEIQAEDTLYPKQSMTRENKALALNIGLGSFIAIWGVTHWDYFQTSPRAEPEGWFDRDSGEGGADKVGHTFTTYAMSHALAATYEHWGFESEKAARYGSLSAFGIQSFMEFGDSFSKYGFSYEDFIANAVGSAAGYLTWRHPEIREKLDFRMEYAPSFEQSDFFTDYESQKYVLAYKLSSLEGIRNGPLKYLELQAGYYTRGYDNQVLADNERIVYFGIGLNLSQIAKEAGYRKIGTFLNYYQVPYTYLPARHKF